MEIDQLTINFFSGVFLALFTIGLSFNFRVVKFLNLSYGSFFTFGAYIAYHFFLKSIVTSILGIFFFSIVLGSLLYLIVKKIGTDVLSSTIASLGFGILLEEVLRMTHMTGYFLIIDVPIKEYNFFGISLMITEVLQLLVLLTLLLTLTFIYKSKHGVRLKFVEEDVELAAMYGVNNSLYEILCILGSSFIAMILGFLSSLHQAIFPSMGWGVLVSGIIALAIASQFKFVGIKHYATLVLVCIIYAEVVGWLQ